MESKHTQAPVVASTTTIYNANRAYAAVGGLMIAGLLIVGAMGYVGVNGPGVLTLSPAFFVMGSSILILAIASLYLLFTLRSTISVLKVHEQTISKLQATRDGAQDNRLSSLEGTRANAGSGLNAQLTPMEDRIASLERARSSSPPVTGAQLAPPESRIASLERTRTATPIAAVVPANGPTAARADTLVRSSGTVLVAPTMRNSIFGDVSPVIDVEGIGPVYAEALKGMGIHDTRQLWEANAATVATSVDAPVSTVHKWQQMAELIAIKGIGPQYAELLQRSGVGSIAELKAYDPDVLLARVLKTQNALDVRIQGNTIGHATVVHWVQAARDHKGG